MIAGTSQAIRKILYDTLEAIESDPAAFDDLENIPDDIANLPGIVGIKKAKLISKRHDFWLIFAHWHFSSDIADHVDLLLAFKRKDGYRIDWDWVKTVLQKD